MTSVKLTNYPPTPTSIKDKISSIHAVSGTRGARTDLEMRYYRYHHANGTRLRTKYRPPR